MRETILLDEVYSEILIEATKFNLQTYTAALIATSPGADASKNYHSKVFEVNKSLSRLLMPWVQLAEEADIQDAKKEWEAFEERSKTDEFKQQQEKVAKILYDALEPSRTDAQLRERLAEHRGSNKIINRKKFN